MAALALASAALAQTSPTANTFSTIAGGYTGTYVVGGVCGGASSGSPYVAADTLGNGCPGPYAKFGASLGGLGTDGAGNVYVLDTTNSEIRKVDAKSGIVTRVAGGGTNCNSGSGQQDSYGSGCPNAQTALMGGGNIRGMNVDYYGNIIVPGYSGAAVEIVCLSQSPLCPIAAGASNPGPRKQVGYMYRVAGCVASQGSGGTSASGADGDGTVATPFENLAGDVSDWGSGAVVGASGTQTCSSSVGSVDQPRNATADKYGNVWIADTSNSRYRVVLGPLTSTFFTGNNPLYAVIQSDSTYATAHYGYIYPIMGGFTAPASGVACGTGTSTDTLGDGCPFYQTATGSSTAGLTVDYNGNPIFFDQGSQLVRVLYVGGTAMSNLITAITGSAPKVGYVYAIEGTGTASVSSTPVKTSVKGSFSYDVKGAVDSFGNIYIGNNSPLAVYEIDATTGYIRSLFASGSACSGGVTTNGAGAAIGDGCPAGQATFTSAGGSIGMPIAVDNLNNVYLADNQGYVRKVLSTGLYTTAQGAAAFTQNLLFHEPVGTTGVSAALLNADSGITVSGTPTCVLNTAGTSDSTADCTVKIAYAPSTVGTRRATLAVTNAGTGTTGTTLYPISGNATGASLVVDGSSTQAASTYNGTAVTPTTLAADFAGNLYTVNQTATAVDKIASGGAVTAIGSSYPTTPLQTSVDAFGNVYITGSGTANITKLTLGSGGSYTTSSITSSIAALPQAVVFDAQNNMYIADASTKAVYVVPVDGVAPGTGAVALLTGLNNPTGLALDSAGNVIVADKGNSAVYRYSPSTGTVSTIASAAGGTNIVTIAGLVPVAIGTDPGNNLYIQDGASKKVYEIPYQTSGTASATSIVVHSGETTPSGVAVSGAGSVYVADSGAGAVLAVNRAPTYGFGTNAGTSYAISGTFSNAGNTAIIGYSESNSEFAFDQTGSSTCGTIPAAIGTTLQPGAQCNYTLYFAQGTSGNPVSGTVTPITSSALGEDGDFILTGTDRSGSTWSTSTTATLQGSSTPQYAASGTEATFTVSVANTSGTNTDVPTGTVTITLNGCSGGGGNYNLSNGSVSVPVSGCPAGSPTITAAYYATTDASTANSQFGASNSGAVGFTVAQIAPSVTWSPGATSQPFSAPLGNAVLDATANVPGAFVYKATPTGGAAQEVHAASYLALGTYALNVTFYPTDAVDYTQATASVASFTVTQATTTAPIGGSQFLVAADGSGNYTTVQAAVNALGVNGGSVYIKPGTYGETTYNNDTNGSITVVQPNVALRGLGGDPTKVILSHSGGAFGSSYAYVPGAYTAAQDNGSQLPTGSTVQTGDPGSATLVVAQGVNTALGGSTTKYYPSNFYAENLTVNNVYNTDTVGTTTAYLTTAGSQSTCSATAGAAQTYSYIYNNNLECGSQALAIYTIADTSVMNNVYSNSLQDTVYAGSISTGSAVAARQYWFRGEISGDVDYIFGDAAAVFDHMSIYSAWHGTAATGTDTIEAQNAGTQAGASGSYLSGYIMNSDIFTSQSTGMTNLYFGRPYGTYSTWIMLNSYVDQLNAGTTPGSGYTTGLGPTLTSATYGEYNDHVYTDPTVGTADANGVLYPANGQNSLATGGNTGQNVLSSGTTSARENVSTNPGYGAFTANGASNNVGLTPAQAQQFYPVAFFSKTVTTPSSDNNGVAVATTWDPTAAIKADVNAFVPASGSPASITAGQSITLLMRPQTPGLGAITASNGTSTYTIPTGTYTLYDNSTQIATGSLDASGEATYISSSLTVGNHSFTWSYGGDSNFAASSTTAAYALTVNGVGTTTTLSETANPINYGQSASVTATVTTTSGTPAGSVTLTIDGGATQTQTLSSGATTFTVTGLSAGSHSFTASYGGGGIYAASSTTSSLPLTVSQLPLVVTGSCTNRAFYTANSCSASVSGSYGYSDNAATVFATGPTGTTTAQMNSPAGTYPTSASYTLTTAGNTNYAVTTQSGTTFTITGSASSAQSIVFPPLPPLPGGTYQLAARSTSGLPVTYTVSGTGASISGTTLVLSGATGNTITVTATQTDTNNDFVTASASRSFIAQ